MRPKSTPSVRATRGRRSGPITTRATMPITRSSEKPMSNMHWARERGRRAGGARSGLLAVLHLGVDGGAGLGRDLARGLGLVALHAVLESLHGAAEVGAHVAQFLGAEDEQHDDQDDQPVPDAERTHAILLCRAPNYSLAIMRGSGFGPPMMWMC